MENNIFSRMLRTFKTLFLYRPSQSPPKFVLPEAAGEGQQQQNAGTSGTEHMIIQLQALLRYAQRLSLFMEKFSRALRQGHVNSEITQLQLEYEGLLKQQNELSPLLLGYYSAGETTDDRSVSASLEENRRTIQALYEMPLNQSLTIRSFSIAQQPPVKVMLVYIDGISDKKMIHQMVLEPLMFADVVHEHVRKTDLLSYLIDRHLPAGGTNKMKNFTEIQDGINSGDAALFVDGVAEAVLIDTRELEHRAVDRPLTEQSIRGSQNSFNEILGTNIALIRSTLKASDLVSETFIMGERSRNKCAIMYLKSLASPVLVAEVRRRINGIKTDYLASSGDLEQFIEDAPFNLFPQILSTERPDRVSVHLSEGRVAVILDGSPFVLILPVNFFTFIHSPDDFSIRFPYGTFIRITRMLGVMTSVLLPAFYVAITTFHQESIPTDLLLAITAARAQVPFPTLFEILMMEIAFELIREGGIRIPGLLGPTIGIVGAIILGQAAVMAKIVSPVMIIVVSVTGLAAYVIPDFRFANSLRFMRFAFLFAAAAFGFVGISTGLLLWVATMCSLNSFGVPYLTPIAPKTFFGYDILVRGPVYSQEMRPDALSPQDPRRQPQVSRIWTETPPEGSGEQ